MSPALTSDYRSFRSLWGIGAVAVGQPLRRPSPAERCDGHRVIAANRAPKPPGFVENVAHQGGGARIPSHASLPAPGAGARPTGALPPALTDGGAGGGAADEAGQEGGLAGPGVEQDLGWDQASGVPQHEGDDHHVVEGADHGQELGDEVDG